MQQLRITLDETEAGALCFIANYNESDVGQYATDLLRDHIKEQHALLRKPAEPEPEPAPAPTPTKDPDATVEKASDATDEPRLPFAGTIRRHAIEDIEATIEKAKTKKKARKKMTYGTSTCHHCGDGYATNKFAEHERCCMALHGYSLDEVLTQWKSANHSLPEGVRILASKEFRMAVKRTKQACLRFVLEIEVNERLREVQGKRREILAQPNGAKLLCLKMRGARLLWGSDRGRRLRCVDSCIDKARDVAWFGRKRPERITMNVKHGVEKLEHVDQLRPEHVANYLKDRLRIITDATVRPANPPKKKA